MKLTSYGTVIWAPVSIGAVALGGLMIVLQWWWGLIPIVAVWLFVLNFFRDPHRPLPANLAAGDMISPADGTVSAVEIVDDHPAIGGRAVIVRIFLSVLNVHINRAPFDCSVVRLEPKDGTYYDARTPESAELNACNLITLRVPSGRTIGVRQVTGKVARRIVCPLQINDELRRGERFGMIRFGSTTELILPDPEQVTVHVKVGDTVTGGLTVLATCEPRLVVAAGG